MTNIDQVFTDAPRFRDRWIRRLCRNVESFNDNDDGPRQVGEPGERSKTSKVAESPPPLPIPWRPVAARPSPSGAMEGDSFSSRSSTSSSAHRAILASSFPPYPLHTAVHRCIARADPSSSSSSPSSSSSSSSSFSCSSISSPFSLFLLLHIAAVYGDSHRYGCRSPYGKKLNLLPISCAADLLLSFPSPLALSLSLFLYRLPKPHVNAEFSFRLSA